MDFININLVFGIMLLSFYYFFYQIKIKACNIFFVFLLLLNPIIKLLISFEIIILLEKEYMFCLFIFFSFLLTYLSLKISTYGQKEIGVNYHDDDKFR